MIVIDLLNSLEVNHSFQLDFMFICRKVKHGDLKAHKGSNCKRHVTKQKKPQKTYLLGSMSTLGTVYLRSRRACVGCGQKRTTVSSRSWSFLPSWPGSPGRSSQRGTGGSTCLRCGPPTQCERAGQSHPFALAGTGSAGGTGATEKYTLAFFVFV